MSPPGADSPLGSGGGGCCIGDDIIGLASGPAWLPAAAPPFPSKPASDAAALEARIKARLVAARRDVYEVRVRFEPVEFESESDEDKTQVEVDLDDMETD